MRLDGLDREHRDGPLNRLDPRLKLVAALTFIVAVVLTPLEWTSVLALEFAVLAMIILISRMPLLEIIKRWIGFSPLVFFLALVISPGHPSRQILGFWPVVAAIVLKNSMAFGAIVVLSGVTPFPKLLNAMRGLGVPVVLVATLHFMVRYIHVLGDELGRMVLARRSRSFRRSGLDYGILTGLIGVLFVRAMERGERVHSAMLARGWDGTIRTLDDEVSGR